MSQLPATTPVPVEAVGSAQGTVERTERRLVEPGRALLQLVSEAWQWLKASAGGSMNPTSQDRGLAERNPQDPAPLIQSLWAQTIKLRPSSFFHLCALFVYWGWGGAGASWSCLGGFQSQLPA